MGKRIKKICLMIGSFFLAILHIYNKGKQAGKQDEQLKQAKAINKVENENAKTIEKVNEIHSTIGNDEFFSGLSKKSDNKASKGTRRIL